MKQHRKIFEWKRLKLGLFLFLLLAGAVLTVPNEVSAASGRLCTIKTCEITGSGDKIKVKVKVPKKTKEMGSKLYLIELNAYNSANGSTDKKPVASAKAKKGTITFKTALKTGDSSNNLYSKFVVAYKNGGKYKMISNASYITNPQAIATYRSSYPETASKKGLQVENTQDALELGVDHAVINWTLSSIMQQTGTPYNYKGKTYYFNEGLLQSYDEMIRTYNENGTKVTVILLLPNDAEPAVASMRYSSGSSQTLYSSVNSTSKDGCRQFEAAMNYLAKRYGQQEHVVSGWILGNEINAARVWNYGGNKSLGSYMDNYVRSYRICYNAVRSVNKNAKVYVSVDYNWNTDADGSGNGYFSTKATLDKFNQKLKEQGKVKWNIAYHAYPQGLVDSKFWDDSRATNGKDTKIINFKNIKVLTDYVKKKYGKKCTIMLSEQSFNTNRGDRVQAAAYAYAYYISEGNDMIESFIYGRHYDHPVEMAQSYYWGLCDNAGNRRLIWDVFQYINTKDSFKFTNPLKKELGFTSWKKKVPGFKDSKFKNMQSIREKASFTSITSDSTSSVTLNWEKFPSATGYYLYRSDDLGASYNQIAKVTANIQLSYQDTGLATGKTYLYKIKTYKNTPDGKEICGSRSPAMPVTVSVGPVTIKSAQASGKTIKVKWDTISGAGGYEIFRSEKEEGTYDIIGSVPDGNEGSYKDTSAMPGNTYYYKVRAFVDIAGQHLTGEFSGVKSDRSMPDKVTLTATPSEDGFVLNWTEAEGVDGYRIYWKNETTGKSDKRTIDKGANRIQEFLSRSWTYKCSENDICSFEIQAYVVRDEKKEYGEKDKIDSIVYKKPAAPLDPAGLDEVPETETETPETEIEMPEVPDTETSPVDILPAETETMPEEVPPSETDTQSTETETSPGEEESQPGQAQSPETGTNGQSGEADTQPDGTGSKY